MLLSNIFYNLIHPYETLEKIRWRLEKKSFKACGEKTSMGYDFTLRGVECISLGMDCHFGRHNQLSVYTCFKGEKLNNQPQLLIGNKVIAMDNCQISCANKVLIGDGTLLGDNVFITDNYHGDITLNQIEIPPMERDLSIESAVIVGKNVWIGRNVCIMPGVKIGDGAIVGANAVVTKDVPERTVAGGVPAKVIKNIR